MKYCSHCGASIEDEAVVCPQCGCATSEGEKVFGEAKPANNSNATLALVAKIFMIISCVLTVLTALINVITYANSDVENAGIMLVSSIIGGLLPLCWMIPMTVKLNNDLEAKKPLTVCFKVCTLIFCSIVAGICLLCRKEEK